MPNEVPCILCSNDDAEVAFDTGVAQMHRIVRCRNCDLLYANPRALEYEHQDEPEEELNFEPDGYHAQRCQKEKYQVEDYSKTRRLLNSLHPQRGQLLEVGSGFGYLLAKFREEGWAVTGCDPWKAACTFARNTHGIDAKPTILEDAGIADETFDVVILNHVIEHMTDPLQSLREINRVLKPGGHLVIETPRYDTLMFKLLGRRERSVSCDGHIYFFTSESLEKLYNRAGFQKTKLWYTGRTLSLERLMWNFGVMSKSVTAKKVLASLSQSLRLNKLRIYLNTRDMQRACVQKV
jgi:SAM-dependent methyltransferase